MSTWLNLSDVSFARQNAANLIKKVSNCSLLFDTTSHKGKVCHICDARVNYLLRSKISLKWDNSIVTFDLTEVVDVVKPGSAPTIYYMYLGCTLFGPWSIHDKATSINCSIRQIIHNIIRLLQPEKCNTYKEQWLWHPLPGVLEVLRELLHIGAPSDSTLCWL